MFVEDWMARQVVSVGPDDAIPEAVSRMKEHGVRHLAVVEGGRVVGVITDRDIKEYSPSPATTLSIYELNYLLARAKVRDAMHAPPVTTAPDVPIEEAALALIERGVGCLPVLEAGRLVGIVTEVDIDRALVDITGVRHGGHRICVTVEDRSGSIRELADVVRAHGFHLQGVLSSYEGAPGGCRRVVLRTDTAGDFEAMRDALSAAYRDVRLRRG